MKQFIGALATALVFWKLKAEGLRLKAVGQLSQKQLTNRLPQPASHNPDASGFAMTGEGGAVLVNRSALLYDSAPKSNDHSLTVDSALFYAAVMQKIKHWLCSRKRSGEFFWLLFLRKKKLLAFPPAMRREDYALQDYFKKRFNSESSQKEFTRGLPQPASHNPNASGFTMTGEGGAVLVNGSVSVNSSINKSNERLLTGNSALAVAVGMQKFLHFHCSNWRSGGSLLLSSYRESNSLRGNEREDYGLQNIFGSRRILFIERENGSCALGLPSLIGGTRPSPFCLDTKGTKKSRLSNLWLKQLRIGAQTEPFRYAALLQFASSPFRKCFLTPNLLRPSLRGGSAGFAESRRFRTCGEFSQKQSTQGLSQTALLNADASGFAMTGEGGAVLVNGSVLLYDSAPKSNDHSLTENSALAVAVKKQKLLHFHCSNWRSGGSLLLSSYRESNSLRGNEREDYGLQKNFKFKDNRKPSQKQLTRGLPQPASHNPDASGFTMTGEGGAVLVNGSVSVNSSICKSNDRLLLENSALAVAVKKQKLLHFHCSNWRSGGSLLLSSYRESNSLRGNEREDYGLQYYFNKRFNSELRQKQLTRGLPPRSSAKVDAGLSDKSEQAITMTGEGEGTCMLKAKRLKLKALTIIIALTVVVIVGKRTNAQIKPLQIGDQVPNLMLENILNSNTNQIALSDLYQKPMVLIFWNSGCRETRAQMATINNWQNQFKGEVGLVSLALENEQLVKKYLETPPLKEQFKLPTVIGDTQLSQLFPHHIHPHVVWLAKVGIVKSITAIDYLTPENVSEFAKGKNLNLPQKIDRMDFKIGVNSLLKEENNKKTYYSVVKPYIPGINPAFKVWIDSSTHSIHTQVVNFPAYKIYLMAFGKFLGIPPNQVIWNVASQDKYVYQETWGYLEEWKQQSYYSYESVWPMDIPVTERLERIRTDLNAALGLNVRMETRDTTVLRLVSTGTITPSKGGKALNVMEPEKPVKLLQNAGLGVLIYEMNQQSQNPPVIDETGFKGTVDMELPFDSFTNIPQINKALESYHLKFEAVKRPILFLVFQEKNFKP